MFRVSASHQSVSVTFLPLINSAFPKNGRGPSKPFTWLIKMIVPQCFCLLAVVDTQINGHNCPLSFALSGEVGTCYVATRLHCVCSMCFSVSPAPPSLHSTPLYAAPLLWVRLFDRHTQAEQRATAHWVKLWIYTKYSDGLFPQGCAEVWVCLFVFFKHNYSETI